MSIGESISLPSALHLARVPPGVGSSRATRRARLLACILALALGALTGLSAAGSAKAAGLECPEISPAVPNVLAGAPQLDRMTTANTVDLANEVNGLIARLKTEKPGISNDEITDVLIAAFCPVVAAKANLSPTDKWRLMHRFDTVVLQQISAATMPPGSQIIASIPLPPDVFRDLSTKAETAGQQPTQYMATILMKAVGR
ncbi:MAG: hypothetical protein R3D62_13350 [Xanthobacteraceae bacterium]